MNKTLKRGFTLIELLVVIAIIGILASVIMVSLGSARSKAADAKKMSDIRSLMSAIELYKNDNDALPANFQALVDSDLISKVPDAEYKLDVSCDAGASYFVTHANAMKAKPNDGDYFYARDGFTGTLEDTVPTCANTE